MFDQLSDRLQATLSEVRSRGKLSEADVDRAMREIRLALLEADVNFKVVKSFTADVKERCLGAGVLDSLDPGQQVVKIVNEELATLMGGAGRDLAFASSGTTVILMAGLQGSGKTTACAKLAKQLAGDGRRAALAACDTQRPAAVDQLVAVGKRAGVPVYQRGTDSDPVEIAEWAVNRARAEQRDVLIVDTAGRLHIDEELMHELARIKKRIKPHDVLLVLDSMTGQDAVNVADEFAERTDFDGVLLTKLDGDARGGAALIEKAEEVSDRTDAEELERKIRKQQFTLEDFLTQMRQVRRMGPLSNVLGMMPGMGGALKQLRGANMDEGELDRLEAIILSMTPQERTHPEVIKGSRRKRIAQGSGTTVQAVNQLTKQFGQMQKLMKQLAEGKMPSPEQLIRGR